MTDHASRTVTVDVAVRGRDNYKYFRRPVGQTEALPDIKYEPEKVRLPTPPQKETPRTRTVGTQSIYRESETQTIPYSPNYILPADGSEPEVLHLQRLGLDFTNGLPAGVAEVELIERARQRREFEASLPPLTGNDPAMFAQRQKMLEEQEVKEQMFRANQIKKVQQERLQALETGLRSRDAERDRMLATRVESMVERRVASRDDAMDKLQTEHVKELRKLAEKHKNVEQRKEKRNIIEDYSNFASKVYSAPAREGNMKTGLGSTIGNTTSTVLSNYTALDDMDMKVTQTISPSKQELTGLRMNKMRRDEVALATQLANVDAAIIRSKNPRPAALPPPSVAQRIERPPPRPPTPTVNSEQQTQPQSPPQSQPQFTHSRPPPRPSTTTSTAPLSPSTRRSVRMSGVVSAGGMREDETEHQEAQSRAIILLQRLLRGRAMQNQMFEGKERRRDLIQELRTEIPEEMVEEDKKYHEEVDAQEAHEERIRAVAAAVVGMEVGTTLDFLAKELVRTRQLAEITRMVRAAEAMRMQREIAEGEARRAQEAMRQRVDWEYNEMQKVHALTVGTYLDEIRGAAVRHAAKAHADAALAGIQAQKEKERIAQMERMRRELGEEFDEEEWEIQHFVATFLLPAVDKELSRQDVDVQANRHSMAVVDSLQSALLAIK